MTDEDFKPDWMRYLDLDFHRWHRRWCPRVVALAGFPCGWELPDVCHVIPWDAAVMNDADVIEAYGSERARIFGGKSCLDAFRAAVERVEVN